MHLQCWQYNPILMVYTLIISIGNFWGEKNHTVFMLTDLYREISKQYSVVIKLYL